MKKKFIKYIIITIIIILILVLLFLIYNNLFAGVENLRYENIEKYNLTNNEKNSAENKLKELEEVKDVKIYIDSKIIKLVVKLTEDVDFDELKKKANESLTSITEKNLSFYDVEIFIESENAESEVYPKIGYKFKKSSEFSW